MVRIKPERAAAAAGIRTDTAVVGAERPMSASPGGATRPRADPLGGSHRGPAAGRAGWSGRADQGLTPVAPQASSAVGLPTKVSSRACLRRPAPASARPRPPSTGSAWRCNGPAAGRRSARPDLVDQGPVMVPTAEAQADGRTLVPGDEVDILSRSRFPSRRRSRAQRNSGRSANGRSWPIPRRPRGAHPGWCARGRCRH